MWNQQQQQQQQQQIDFPGQAKAPLLLPSSSCSSSSSFPRPADPQEDHGGGLEGYHSQHGLPIVENSAAHQAYFHHQGPAGHGSIAGVHLSHFRDFLSRPLKAATASVAAVPVQPAAEGSSRSAQPPTGSTPATCLSLNSGVDFQHMETMIPGTCPADRRHHSSSSTSSSLTAVTFSDSPFPGLFVFCNNKKRAPQQQQPNAGNGSGAGDSRNKRMIKNRESAARSRARKQAYTNELELEVNHLTKENEMLRRQHEELRAKLAAQLFTKRALQRSSTAPF